MRNKKILAVCLSTVLLLALIAVTTPALAKPTAFTVPYNQAQFQWRTPSWGGPFGDWSSVYQNSATTSDFNPTFKE